MDASEKGLPCIRIAALRFLSLGSKRPSASGPRVPCPVDRRHAEPCSVLSAGYRPDHRHSTPPPRSAAPLRPGSSFRLAQHTSPPTGSTQIHPAIPSSSVLSPRQKSGRPRHRRACCQGSPQPPTHPAPTCRDSPAPPTEHL